MRERTQRWRVLAAGIFSLLLAMGVARFAYTPLLPLMQSQAGLGLGEAGWLAAINYLGYLSGAVLVSRISDLRVKDRLYRAGLVLAVLSTAMMVPTTSFAVWGLSRYLAGLATAAAMLLGTGLILNWLIRHDHPDELGIHFSGVGLGIAGSASMVAGMTPWLTWKAQWLVLAAIGAALLLPALRWLPPPEGSVATRVTNAGATMADAPPSPLFMRVFLAYYFCTGVAYAVSATFIVAIVNRLPGLTDVGNWAFLAIGLAAAPACIAWDLIARRTGDLNALLIATVLEIGGVLLPVVGSGLVDTLVGAVLFGSTMMGIVSLVLTMAGRYYPTRPAKMMGKMTISYGIAQIVAPAVTGWIAIGSGSYRPGLYLAAVVLGCGVLLLFVLKAVVRREIRQRVRACGLQAAEFAE